MGSRISPRGALRVLTSLACGEERTHKTAMYTKGRNRKEPPVSVQARSRSHTLTNHAAKSLINTAATSCARRPYHHHRIHPGTLHELPWSRDDRSLGTFPRWPLVSLPHHETMARSSRLLFGTEGLAPAPARCSRGE